MKREKKIAFIEKYPYICYNGPFVGHVLYLAAPSTPEFIYNGRKGRYVVSYGTKRLVWENTL